MIYQNHVIDPTFFYDAIEQFAFNFELYVLTSEDVDDYGRRIQSYTRQVIRGSLQSAGKQLNQSKDGNTITKSYDFYCKSLYRINIGDIIVYKNDFYRVDSVNDYDEYGVRSCHLTMVSLTAYRDLAEYIKYLNGEKLV